MNYYRCYDGFCGASDCARCGNPEVEETSRMEDHFFDQFYSKSIDDKLDIMKDYFENDEIDFQEIIDWAIKHSALLNSKNISDNMMDKVCEIYIKKKMQEE